MNEAWLSRTADQFWAPFQGPPAPPRDLTMLISRPFPISIVTLSDLSTLQVERWFHRQHIPYRSLCQNRSLCGCIIAARGHGLIFLDADDSAAERRFTIAHEVAHFLLDYLTPRQQALAALGESIRAVLDGERPPSTDERIHAALSDISLGVYTDMMPRNAQGSIDQGSILRAEHQADRLALELLAPADDVIAALPASAFQLERVRSATDLLTTTYGLPRTVARTYAAVLVPQRSQPSMSEWLGL